MQMNRVVIAGYVPKTAGKHLPSGTLVAMSAWARASDTRTAAGNTGTHELAQPRKTLPRITERRRRGGK